MAGKDQEHNTCNCSGELGLMIIGRIQKGILTPLQPIKGKYLYNKKAFTLIELLIAMSMAALVAMAGFQIFSTTNVTFQVQEAVGEAQQNARVALDVLARDIRMAGFGLPDPPFSLTIGSSGALEAPITPSDGGATETDSITILGIGYEAGTMLKGTNTDCNGRALSKICLNNVDAFKASDGSFKASRKYINVNGTRFIELSDSQPELSSNKIHIKEPLDKDYDDGTDIFIIQAVQYSIVDDEPSSSPPCTPSSPCLKSLDYTELRGSDRQTLAENIEDLQFAFGVDSNRDRKIDTSVTPPYNDPANEYGENDFITAPSDNNSIVAIRATVVAVSRTDDREGKTFARPDIENHSGGSADELLKRRRRMLTKTIKLRNPSYD